MKQFSGIILSCLMLATAQAASFDCAKANTNIEKMVCGDSNLSKLDDYLTKAYQQALERSVDKQSAIQEQRRWLNEVRDSCQNIGCLKTIYSNRIDELKPLQRFIPTFRGELKEIEKLNDFETFAEIRLYMGKAVTPFQRIAVDIWIKDPVIEFVDINGDGYKDLLFYGICGSGSQCNGPSPYAADVYLYAPEWNKFALVASLSGKGEVKPASGKGCATVDYKSGPAGYTTETWCVNQSSGVWQLTSMTGGEPSE